VGKPVRKKLPGSWWVDNIKMALGEIEWSGVDWFGLAHDRDNWRDLVNAVMNLGSS
jgi:hypothetical protein